MLVFASEMSEFSGIGNADDVRVSIQRVQTSPAPTLYSTDLLQTWKSNIQSPVSGTIYVYVRVYYGSNVTIETPSAAIKNLDTGAVSILTYNTNFTPLVKNGYIRVWKPTPTTSGWGNIAMTSKLYEFTFNTTSPNKIVNSLCELKAHVFYTIGGTTRTGKYFETATVKVQNLDTQEAIDVAQAEEAHIQTRLDDINVIIAYPDSASTSEIKLPYTLNQSQIKSAFTAMNLNDKISFTPQTMTMPLPLGSDAHLARIPDPRNVLYHLSLRDTVVKNIIGTDSSDNYYFVVLRERNSLTEAMSSSGKTLIFSGFITYSTDGSRNVNNLESVIFTNKNEIDGNVENYFVIREHMLSPTNPSLTAEDRAKGVAQRSNVFNNIVAHEIGHALGFMDHCEGLIENYPGGYSMPCLMGDGDKVHPWYPQNIGSNVWCDYKETEKHMIYTKLKIIP